jgi:hypothetical protein
MGDTQAPRHFRINPVELAIFSLISLVFLKSVYNLFYDQQGLHPSTVVSLTPEGPEAKALAAQAGVAGTPLFLNYDLRCDANTDQNTSAGKVRLTGVLCAANGAVVDGRSPASSEQARIEQITVTNLANKFSATVFTDSNAGKFSTDYIPLNLGRNPIEVQFTYVGGKSFTRSFSVEKH